MQIFYQQKKKKRKQANKSKNKSLKQSLGLKSKVSKITKYTDNHKKKAMGGLQHRRPKKTSKGNTVQQKVNKE